MMVVFLCARTLRRIPYDGGAGLEFVVPSKWCAQTIGAVTQFWSDFGPVIKLAAFAVTAAVTATTGVRLSEVGSWDNVAHHDLVSQPLYR